MAGNVNLTLEEFKAPFRTMKSAKSVPNGKLYQVSFDSFDTITVTRESGSKPTFSVRLLFDIYQNLDDLETTSKYIDIVPERKRSALRGILVAAGYYSEFKPYRRISKP